MGNSFFTDEIIKLYDIENQYNSLFNNNDFLEYDDVYSVTNNLLPERIEFRLSYIKSFFTYLKYKKMYESVLFDLSNVKSMIDSHNNEVFINDKASFKSICGLIEGKSLDDQQIYAIVRKNKNQLVIAGAGSGKTTTIVGKVKYLLLKEKYNPEDILLLSFTNASASEMQERVKKETNIDLDVMTFHKLGLEIIKKSLGRNIKIFNKDLYLEVKELLNKCIESPEYMSKFIYFMSTARFNDKDEFDFDNEKEYQEYLSSNKPTTLKGEVVKSYGELQIANYLFSNNINYVYEQEYKINTMDDNYQQYQPDFYLPDYDIYIEYFGIDENNNVAPYFKGRDGLSAKDIYNESIKWKRETHKINNTTMIETFYYENKQGILLSNLEKNLKSNGVKIEPKSEKEIWDIINNNNTGLLNEICNVFSTIINLIKSNNYNINDVMNIPGVFDSQLNQITLDLIRPIYESYQQLLAHEEMIDFNDMINMATDAIINSRFIYSYKYVIVDEYQDMSVSRYKLLKAMRDQREYKLFCVGDDWQSIYRFNGSDIDLITNFEKYWGHTYTSFIEKTYRFNSMMSILSGNFIMKNPNQYKKSINAKPSHELSVYFINGYTEKNCIDFLGDRLSKFEKDSTVYLLGRYSFDIDILKNNENYIIRYDTATNMKVVTYVKRRDLKINFLTVHRSKGLQADYVIILNNKNIGMGFPSKINDLPLIRLLLGGGLEDYPFSEERRLFYVALTRSKKQTLLLSIDNNKSSFVEELQSDYKRLMDSNPEIKRDLYTCPECGGRLVTREGQYGKFIGCSRYPNCTYKRKI